MIDEVRITKLNEVYLKIDGPEDHMLGLIDYFKKRPPNYKFDPRFKARRWDGYIRFLGSDSGQIYVGLLPKVLEWLRVREIPYRIDADFYSQKDFTEEKARAFCDTLKLPFVPRDDQIKYFVKAVQAGRAILLSPTSSGKSLIMFLIARYFNKRTLLITDGTSMIPQLKAEFEIYGATPEEIEEQFCIINYHALVKEDPEWFDQFPVILADEVHHYQANSLKKLMQKTFCSPIRIGLTGTLYDDEVSRMSCEGLFGRPWQFITTKEMMDQGIATPLSIRAIVLDHHNFFPKKPEYQEEIDYLLNCTKRDFFIRDLALKLQNQNTLLMYIKIDYGKKLYEMIKKEAKVPVFFVAGAPHMTVEEREEIRKKIDTLKGCIIICSKVFQTGINIKSIDNIIFTHPSKSRIRVMQSIGRGLRKMTGKLKITLYDIADKLTDSVFNITFDHYRQRIMMYNDEKFSWKEYNSKL